jgi:HK97 gp10 family phage protein
VSRRAADRAGKAIFVGAGILETEARRLIVAGAIQGAGHIPSAPGDPPNRDTGQLDQSITARRRSKLKSQVSVGAPYGLFLEFGTALMAERPFMRPATKRTRSKITKLVERAVRNALAKS